MRSTPALVPLLRRLLGAAYEPLAALCWAIILVPKHIGMTLTWRSTVARLENSPQGLQVHVGCGSRHMPGMLNCDARATWATDMRMDCAKLAPLKNGSARVIFANAFFEHLYRRQQVPFLRECGRVLAGDGVLVLLGIPDFHVVAESYIGKVPGYYSPQFGLYDAHRATHGDPEQAPRWWLKQLHKSLFDRASVEALLGDAGFCTWTTFRYCFPGETVPINLGVVAWRNEPTRTLRDVLTPFSDYIADVDEPVTTGYLWQHIRRASPQLAD